MKAEHLEMDNSEITTEKQLTKKDIWERKLLDFSLRNTMLNLGIRRRAIRFVGIKVDKVEDLLHDGEEFSIWYRMSKDEKKMSDEPKPKDEGETPKDDTQRRKDDGPSFDLSSIIPKGKDYNSPVDSKDSAEADGTSLVPVVPKQIGEGGQVPVVYDESVTHSDEEEKPVDQPLEEQIEEEIEDKQDLKFIEEELAKRRLHTNLGEEETKTILKHLYRAARTAIEETGANSLYLSIGTLRWYESDKHEQPRYAPILLMPIEMVYKRGHYYVRKRDEETVLNVTLMEFLHQIHSIEINGLDNLPKDDHGVDVRKVFDILREAVSEQKRWGIEEQCILGLFSFSKFLMWNDIHRNHERMQQNPIVESLVKGALTWKPSELQTDLKAFDRSYKPQDMALPVAVDSSQMTAVYEGGRGNSFILYGPPGTGKSQTITNLIANALFQGKRVLFVAEKMAALEVVERRLKKIGLGPFCLELHSNKVTKKHVLSQLNEALNEVKHIQNPGNYQETADRLYEQRQELLKYMDALHTRGEDDLSLYDCIARYSAIEGDTMGIPSLKPLSKVKAGMLGDYEYKLSSPLQTLIELVGQPSQHPLHDLLVGKVTLTKQVDFEFSLRKALKYLEDFEQKLTIDSAIPLVETLKAASILTSGGVDTLWDTNIAQSIDNFSDIRSRRDKLKKKIIGHCREEILTQDALALSMEWHEIQGKWFLPKWFAKRRFVKKMRFFDSFIDENNLAPLLEELLDCSKKTRELAELEPQVGQKLTELIDIKAAREKLTRWYDNIPQVRDWYQWCEFRNELKKMGLDVVVDQLETNSWNVDELRNSFMKGFFRAKCEEKMSAAELLGTFEGVLFDEKVRLYKELTSRFEMLCQKELYARLAANVPRVTDSIDNSSEIGLLNRNISNGGRGLSIRGLLDQIPELLPRLCPCMLMSPMSVAQFISLNQEPFDLVIFDEASQMPTSEAVGAIARGKALIVVGDPKQMPPTNFFNATNVDEEEAYIDDMESILEDCRTLGIPSLQLQWHYRSRHESLIAFSNNEYYDGKLITFPSSDDRQTKVSYVFVDGVYDKGGKRSNRGEAEAIVAEVVRRLRDEKLRQQSIGIVSFSVAQQNLVEDVLNETLESDRQLTEWAEAMYEPIFVKNLENVQGDERDVILFSIGYGPDKEGHVSMNFGPLNNSGGERRLNVAVSRARREMMVFSTMHAAQIDLRRSKAKGVEGLKHFLEYAEFHTLEETERKVEEREDNAIAAEIADALRERGYDVQLGVGKSQFKVDLAVASHNDSNQYCLGILLDGENYRDTQTTRDREIVQPGVLQGLAWHVMRVWSVDWLINPNRVLERIEKAIVEPEPEPEPEEKPTFDISNEKEVAAPKQTNYRRFDRNIDEISSEEVRQALLDVVHEQLSLPEDNATLLAAKRLGFTRRGPHVEAALQRALRYLIVNGQLVNKDGKLTIPS
jgi:hypothetical protein